MKKNATVLILCMTICVSLVSFNTPAVFAASSRINVATSFNLGHPVMRRVLQPWAEEVRRQSGGRIDMHFYNPGTMVPEREHFSAVKMGELGIAHAAVGVSHGKLPISSLMDMPSLMTDCLSASEAFWKLYESSPEMQAEFQGIKVLALHATPPCQINLNKGNIRALADFKKQKILTSPSGDSARLLRSLGTNPMITPLQDFAGSLSRGMADGCLLPMNTLRAQNLQENLQSITLCNLRMDSYWLGMNMDMYNALPAEARRTLNELSGLELSLDIARALNDLNNLALSELTKEEVTINVLTPEERSRWVTQISQALRENWLTQLKRRQHKNGSEIWNRAQGIFNEAHAKWGHRAGQQITPAN